MDGPAGIDRSDRSDRWWPVVDGVLSTREREFVHVGFTRRQSDEIARK